MSNSLVSGKSNELDFLKKRPFNPTDHKILKSYEAVVDGLAMLIGEHCEIVLHALEDLKAYFTRAKSGVLMKSVTIAIRNREQRVIGLLCINMNLDVPFSQIVQTFIPLLFLRKPMKWPPR